MQKAEFQKADRSRFIWAGILILGLIFEAMGAVMLFQGRETPGLICALIGVAVWIVARHFGMRQYTKACAHFRLQDGLGLKDLKEVEAETAKAVMPVDVIVPPGTTADRPLLMFTHSGRWHGFPITLSEATVGFHSATERRQYLSGTLAVIDTPCAHPGLIAIYGKPYGGVPLSRWADMTVSDVGERQYLLMYRGETAPDETVLDAFAAFDGKHDKMAVIRTEAERTVIFLPRQFYSGTWTLFKPMSDKDAQEDPLPTLDDLAELIRRLA